MTRAMTPAAFQLLSRRNEAERLQREWSRSRGAGDSRARALTALVKVHAGERELVRADPDAFAAYCDACRDPRAFIDGPAGAALRAGATAPRLECHSNQEFTAENTSVYARR